MNTSDPNKSAAALIRKAADAPLRVYLGFRGIGAGKYSLVTSTIAEGVAQSLPHEIITIEPGADERALAALLTARWADLAQRQAKSGKRSSAKPSRAHRWRRQTHRSSP